MTMHTPRSSIPEIVWPAIPSPAGAMLMALQFQIEQSQWWPAETIEQLQWRQLESLLRHAYESVPHYRAVLNEAGLNPSQPLNTERFARLPLLSRDDIVGRVDELRSKKVPREHGKVYLKSTSGSTGQPLKIHDTEANGLFWYALTLRDHLWHGHDIGGGFVAIRSGRSAKDPDAVNDLDSWGPSSGRVFDTGPMTMFYHLTPIERQAELIRSRDPHYLLAYPSNAARLARYFADHDLTLANLRQVQTYGESIGPRSARSAVGPGAHPWPTCTATKR